MEILQGLITRPVGRLGIKVKGWENPSPFLKRTIINRSEAEEKLVGHEITLVIPDELKARSNPKGRVKEIFDDPFIRITPKLEVHYMTQEYLDKKTGLPKVSIKKGVEKSGASKKATFSLSEASFFSETSKMSAPSWSIPAGPQSIGGSCAAAEIYKNQGAYDKALTQGDVSHTPANQKNWICAYCYAGKSNYMHRTSQYTQMARLIWLKGTVEARGVEASANIMAEALAAHMRNAKYRESVGESTKFFRVSDSGDLTLVPDTYTMWCLVAEQLPEISFWAPTRNWVFPKFNELVRRRPPPANFTLRPSALHFGDKAPDIEGYDAGSTAHAPTADPTKNGQADWECPAYKHGGHSCAGAGGPNGEKDCRFCWTYKDQAVSYRAH